MTTTTQLPPAQSLEAIVGETLTTLDGFSAILTAENEALRTSDFKKLDTLQSEKRAYASKYHELVVKLTDRRSDMSLLNSTSKQKLVEARTAFTLLLQDNMRALELMKNSTQRLANRILEVARQSVAQEQQTGYSAKGNLHSYASSGRSLSLDHNL